MDPNAKSSCAPQIKGNLSRDTRSHVHPWTQVRDSGNTSALTGGRRARLAQTAVAMDLDTDSAAKKSFQILKDNLEITK